MTVALIVAAGSGERLGADRPKALVELAGRPLLQWSIDVLCCVQRVQRIVVAMPPAMHTMQDLFSTPAGIATELTAVEGGAVRSESVRRALAAAGEADLVLVHDAARPLLTVELADAAIDALEAQPDADAAIAAARVTDTIKRADSSGTVLETLDRSQLWAVQTPQVFRREALQRALEVDEEELARATDDAWLVERAGGRVLVVAGSDRNIKITTALDLQLAELLIADRQQQNA
jgi:2-C-methyl-D-erythritol 4-phosphate cytidylyltransferase